MALLTRTAFEGFPQFLAGACGYRERDQRAAADRVLRSYLADRLDEALAALGALGRPPGSGRIEADLARARHSLLTHGPFEADPGPQTLHERALAPLYAYDALLLDAVHALLERIAAVAGTGIPSESALGTLAESAHGLAHAVEKRRDVFRIHER